MDSILIESPPLPVLASLPVIALAMLIILLVLARMRSRAGLFVIAAVWARNIMSAFPAFSFKPVAAGMSANALGSVATFALGLLFIKRRNFLLRFLLPFYLLIALAIVSAVVNMDMSGLLLVVVKYGYLIVITLGVYEACARYPDGRFMRGLMFMFAAPLMLQAASVAMGISKDVENDFSVSYVGGYAHEASFSVTLATLVVILMFTERFNKVLKTGLILGAVLGIYLANYRTTILAVAPLLIVYFGFSGVQGFVKKDRPLVVSGAIVLATIFFGVIGLFLAERFSDLGVAASTETNLFKPPSQYTDDEARVLSGRPYIWMTYIFGWIDGDGLQRLFGFGPESWTSFYGRYAHNTLVSFLYEYGLVGVFAILFVWFSMLAASLRVRHPHKGRLVAAHVSFLLLNMGTMPMWMIEGVILYGVMCGYTLYLLSAPQAAPQRAAQPARRQERPARPYGAKPAPEGTASESPQARRREPLSPSGESRILAASAARPENACAAQQPQEGRPNSDNSSR